MTRTHIHFYFHTSNLLYFWNPLVGTYWNLKMWKCWCGHLITRWGCPGSCVHTLQWSGLRVACASAWGADPHWHWSIDFIQIIIKHQHHKNIVINSPLIPSSHAISEARDVVRCKNNLGYLQYLLHVDKIVCWMKSGGGCGMELFSGNEQKLIRTQEKEKPSASFYVGKQLHS